jgi:cytochrome c-type biogenesis protein CcsB
MTIGLVLSFLIIERWFRIPNLGWAVCLLALVIMFYAGSLPTDINPLQAALRSYWRSIHVPPLLISYGFFTLAFLSSIAYLFSDQITNGGNKKPLNAVATREGQGGLLSYSFAAATELYDEVTYRCISAGFPLLMIGVILGAVWANEAWGNYWSWDPKESMSLVTLLGYGTYLHMRINGEHSPKTLAWVSVCGFLLMLMTFVGVNVWGFGSLHSYGAVK